SLERSGRPARVTKNTKEHEGAQRKPIWRRTLVGFLTLKVLVEHEEEKAQENLSHTRSLTMIFPRALRVSFVLFVTQKAFESKVNSIGSCVCSSTCTNGFAIVFLLLKHMVICV